MFDIRSLPPVFSVGHFGNKIIGSPSILIYDDFNGRRRGDLVQFVSHVKRMAYDLTKGEACPFISVESVTSFLRDKGVLKSISVKEPCFYEFTNEWTDRDFSSDGSRALSSYSSGKEKVRWEADGAEIEYWDERYCSTAVAEHFVKCFKQEILSSVAEKRFRGIS